MATPEGGVDIDALREAIAARLHRVPRFRQRVRWIPFENHPVWVDDHDFNLDYHVRHTSLPRPGGLAQLRTMAARIKAGRMDSRRPLWECWVLEGMEGGRFAIIFKMHNALIEGRGADLLQVLLSAGPEEAEEKVPAFRPRPAPSTAELVFDEVVRGARLPRRALERLARFVSNSEDLPRELLSRLESVARLLGYSIRSVPDTPLNGRTGPHRRFDMLTLSLDEARQVRRRLGGSINDVVLATIAGAVARFLHTRYMNPATIDFRVASPIQLRDQGGVSEWVVDLPIWEKDPLARHAIVRQRTEAAHRESPALGASTLFNVAEWTGSRLLALGARSASSGTPANMTVTNVPGPQVPLYLRGARLLEAYGHAPLREHGALGIALFSYDGKLCWGFNADLDLVPDLDRFTAGVEASFRELVRAAAGGDPNLELVQAS
jgi:WS/DGAT/MGAT family acyltransferase